MPLHSKAKWTTSPRDITAKSETDGSFTASIPLYDSGVKAFTMRMTITADRALLVQVDNEPGAAGLSGFEAWSDF